MPDSNEKYLRLITSEYADKPNFNAFVEAFLDKISPVVDCLTSFNTIFNLNNATGDQLDKWGTLLGVSRELPISDENIPSVLTDDLYRTVLKASILSNMWDGTLEGLVAIVRAMFPNGSFQIVDGQDMSMTIALIDPNADATITALLLNGFIVPKPSGVDTSYTLQEHALFAWDVDTAFLAGWDEGQWSTS